MYIKTVLDNADKLDEKRRLRQQEIKKESNFKDNIKPEVIVPISAILESPSQQDFQSTNSEIESIPLKAYTKCKEIKQDIEKFFRSKITKKGIKQMNTCCKVFYAAHTKKYDKENPDSVIRRRKNRKDLEDRALGFFTNVDKFQIRKFLEDKCAYCNDVLNGCGEFDHITPISKGGTNFPENMTLACRTCNRDKGGKNAIEFLNRRKLKGLFCREIEYLNPFTLENSEA